MAELGNLTALYFALSGENVNCGNPRRKRVPHLPFANLHIRGAFWKENRSDHKVRASAATCVIPKPRAFRAALNRERPSQRGAGNLQSAQLSHT